MKVLFIMAMAFIVPMAGIAVFILVDKGLDKLLSRFKNQGRNKRYPLIKPITPSGKQPLTEQLPVIQPASLPSPVAQPLPESSKVSGCKQCAGCKHAAKGGCARRKQANSSNSSTSQ